ncbi:LETM1-related biofilm-associated protein [Ichthyenterobacterium sp. W332]|uniref:LETM1-related biofilm-associated protein n=1 Tax=Microcosmobacter mediterraneus TaxID=3075607 RepID=A0ABU2YQ25_9FLAO|nr:LETM1-related biofilm-associated protein [Ichthyenterobacterium sp. W332]MDT0559153.1 LETM1-related biofilm-associated protein [Ichthyenterobacterium sp. W332]
MNPSASGWIKKLISQLQSKNYYHNLDDESFYNALRHCGFIYGSNIHSLEKDISTNTLSEEEICKVNLVIALHYVHTKHNPDQIFVASVISFYKALNHYKASFFEELLGRRKSFGLLESIIHKRINIDDNIITKSFNQFVINALLFVDILAFNKYLKNGKISIDYIKQLEAAIEVIVFKVFEKKTVKTEYDHSLLNLIESSLRYHNNEQLQYEDVIAFISSPLEKRYIIDIVCMAAWSDKVIDKEEQEFLHKLKNDLVLNKDQIIDSVTFVNTFYDINKDHIAHLSSKNLVQNFYDNSSKLVNKLIKRNSKRLLKELQESKDIMVLLTKSTTRKLTDEEQKQVQNQLLDIFKSIPSLAIFLLPGGMLLLPLFIKFIPKLLPSAFDDNRLDDELKD